MNALFLILALTLVTVWAIALIQISRAGLDPTAKAVWVLIVIVAPFLGVILWWLIGRPSVLPSFASDRELK
jgi:hypothetical protein